MKKDPNNLKEDEQSWLNRVAEDYDYTSMATDNYLSEDPEFPSLQSKRGEPEATSLYSDADRKKEEIKNSTVGGF